MFVKPGYPRWQQFNKGKNLKVLHPSPGAPYVIEMWATLSWTCNPSLVTICLSKLTILLFICKWDSITDRHTDGLTIKLQDALADLSSWGIKIMLMQNPSWHFFPSINLILLFSCIALLYMYPCGDPGGEYVRCIPMRFIKGDWNGVVSQNNHKKVGPMSVLRRACERTLLNVYGVGARP